MALSWSERRKYTYSGVAIILILAALYFAWNTFFSAPPSCFDGRQNGNELGIDCGGVCSLLCQSQVGQPSVTWVRVFLTATSTSSGQATSGQVSSYTAAAYIQNPNRGAGAHSVPYSFQLFDADNQLVIERTGVADLPPLPVVPILETNIPTGSRKATHALFAFSSLPLWYSVSPGDVVPLSVTNQELSSDGSRLSLVLQNNTVKDAKNITVAGVLFDAEGVALAASKSIVALVPRKGAQEVVFTWASGTPGVVRAEITVLPSF